VRGRAAPDFEVLLAALVPVAEDRLRRTGDLRPFGAALTGDGAVVDLGAHSWLGPTATAKEVVLDLYRAARGAASARRAVAVVQTGRSGGRDAMRIDLEHEDGQCLSVVVDYSLSRFRKTYTRGRLHAGPGVRRVWRSRPTIDLRTPEELPGEDDWAETVQAG
jgi:hypothetical protein